MYYTYLIKSVSSNKPKSYVGYTSNLENRLKKHNSNTGAKSTKGHKWVLVYKKKFKTKNEAMSYEFKLKRDRMKRKKILNKFCL